MTTQLERIENKIDVLTHIIYELIESLAQLDDGEDHESIMDLSGGLTTTRLRNEDEPL